MSRILTNIFILFFLFTNQLIAQENIMILKLKDGDVKIELFEDVAPNHVKRIKELADSGKYDNVVFHRVIDGFMAQTGDVKFGNSESGDFDLRRAGMGGSDLPDLKQEFSSVPHDRGTYQWLDHQIQIVLIVNFLYVLSRHHFLIDSTLFLVKF
jgi:peptidyl-prolyl cis-trans isomerase B (cyclophilin B)